MEKSLIPFDGSDNALRAVQHAVFLAKECANPSIELLYVEDPVPLRLYAALSASEIQRIESEEAERVLQPAKKILDAAGLSYQAVWRSGDPASEIARHAEATQCSAIIMGTRGLGQVASLVIGSVANKVIHLTNVPVTLIK